MAKFAAIGAGILGRSIAHVLEDVVIYDGGGPKGSDVPAAICHPYPGRSFDIPDHQWVAWERASAWFEQHPRGVFPVVIERSPDPRLAASLSRVGECRVPVEQTSEGYRYGGAWVVDVPSYLSQLAPSARVVTGLANVVGTTVVTDEAATSYEAVVVCPGVRLQEWVPELDTETVHGDLASFEGVLTRARFSASHAYPNPSGGVTVGHSFLTAPRSADAAEADFRQRAGQDGVELGACTGVWHGARAVVRPERLPIAYERSSRCFVVGGLGAKGLLFSAILAESMCATILHGAPLPTQYLWPRPR